jgi:hypothetical protein
VPSISSNDVLMSLQRVFTYGSVTIYCIEGIAIIAACGSGVALAMVNIVLGSFITLLSDSTAGAGVPDNFMSEVSKQSFVPLLSLLTLSSNDA